MSYLAGCKFCLKTYDNKEQALACCSKIRSHNRNMLVIGGFLIIAGLALVIISLWVVA